MLVCETGSCQAQSNGLGGGSPGPAASGGVGATGGLGLGGGLGGGVSPLVVVLQPTKEHLAPRPINDPDRVRVDSLLEVVLCALAVALGELKNANLIMRDALLETRRPGLR
jgi:hypothetical protein